MSLLLRVARVVCLPVCLAGLSGALGCHSGDDTGGLGEGKDPSTDPGNGDGGSVKRDASTSDAGKGKDAAVARDTGTAPPDKDDGSTDMGCGSVRAAAQLERGPADIIIVLDTSGSMADEICNVSKNLNTFAMGVGDNAHVISVYEMGVLGLETAVLCGAADPLAATPLAMDPNRYLHLPINVDSWKALTDLNDNFDMYKGFLRPNAPTNIIVVSDDESSVARGGMAAADFKTQMEQKLGHSFIFHAIVADGQNGCSGSNVGTQYLTLADETGGQKLPICATDWSAVFAQLEAAVVSSAPIPCDFDVPMSPAGGTLDPEAVQVVFQAPGAAETQFPRATGMDKCGTQTAWYYNDPNAPTKVELCPAACDAVKQGGDVNIAFGCAPIYAL